MKKKESNNILILLQILTVFLTFIFWHEWRNAENRVGMLRQELNKEIDAGDTHEQNCKELARQTERGHAINVCGAAVFNLCTGNNECNQEGYRDCEQAADEEFR